VAVVLDQPPLAAVFTVIVNVIACSATACARPNTNDPRRD
jgi:hypothetical protein